jgi:Predicted acyl-CoA transferases/carnitine dehydratase
MTYSVLSGLRVLDFGIITAGAGTSALLADLGAEVIKIEGPSYLDPFRKWLGGGQEPDWWNRSPHFRFTNRQKQSVCIDLKSEQGRAVMLDMVAASDIVVENFRAGAMEALGLGYAALKAANPGIILASISSQGSTGPNAASVSFGSTLEGSSGLSSLIRSADGVPQISGHALNYPDQVVALFAAGAIMSALVHRQAGGEGAWLDISQRALASFLLGEHLGAGGEATGMPGAPARAQLIARTLDARWIAVTIETRERHEALLRRWRLAPDADIDALADHIRGLPSRQVLADVHGLGGAAALVRTAGELLDADGPVPASPAIARDRAGHIVKGCPWTYDGVPLGDMAPAPSLGEDNEAVARRVAGLSPQRFEALARAGIFATAPRADKTG